MIPRCAPRPDATNKATGVAKPSAQGQAITITAIALVIDSDIEYPLYQSTPNVAEEITKTIGTKTALI